MTESEYTTRFVTSMIDLILKPHQSLSESKLEEQKPLMIKEYGNNALLEEYSRLPGPNIDGIIKIPKLNLDFVLLEVSGPYCTAAENYNHYKEDRNKIAKNLKYMFKVIIFESHTKIPVEPFLFPSTVPKFMAKLFSLGEKIGHFDEETEKFFRSTEYNEDSDSPSSDLSSCSAARVSPRKRKNIAA